MPRAWFRHDASMRYDPSIRTLGREFGAPGVVAWNSLLELHCESDDGITILREDLAPALMIPNEWNLDVGGAWLDRCAELGLVTVRHVRSRREHTVTRPVQIRARAWRRKNPDYDTKEAQAERKRRSRGKSVTVTSQDGHSDNAVTSHDTVLDVTALDVQDETVLDLETKPRVRDPEISSSTREPDPERNGHAPPGSAEWEQIKRGLAVAKSIPEATA